MRSAWILNKCKYFVLILSFFIVAFNYNYSEEINVSNSVSVDFTNQKQTISNTSEIRLSENLDLYHDESNSATSNLLVSEDVKKILDTLNSYELALEGQPKVLLVQYMHRYIELNFQDQKIKAAKTAVENLIEFKSSLVEIDSNIQANESVGSSEKKNLENLRKKLYERFVAKDGELLYSSFVI